MTTLVLDDAEALILNAAVQVYSRNELFFRSHSPEMTNDFRHATHRCYANHDHPIERMIHDIPGVPPMDTTLARLFARLRH